jgi:hypothetical protein
MKIGGIFFVKSQLILQAILRIMIGVNFIDPERFFIEGVESESEAYKETEG